MKLKIFQLQQDKDPIVLLHEAVNQFERADIVLMKTLILLDYDDRLKTRDQFETKYQIVRFFYILKFFSRFYSLIFYFLKRISKKVLLKYWIKIMNHS